MATRCTDAPYIYVQPLVVKCLCSAQPVEGFVRSGVLDCAFLHPPTLDIRHLFSGGVLLLAGPSASQRRLEGATLSIGSGIYTRADERLVSTFQLSTAKQRSTAKIFFIVGKIIFNLLSYVKTYSSTAIDTF